MCTLYNIHVYCIYTVIIAKVGELRENSISILHNALFIIIIIVYNNINFGYEVGRPANLVSK